MCMEVVAESIPGAMFFYHFSYLLDSIKGRVGESI